MSKSINVPKLRFKEFSGEWEEKLFCDIVTNKSKKYNPEKESISYKCIELEHLSTESGQLLGYVDSLNLGSIKNKFNKNDVLFGKLRPYLKKYLLAPFDGVCSSEIWVLNGINVTNYFLYYIVQSDYFIGLANQSSGSKMPRADWNIIENSIFFIPSKQEQEKIALFLTSVDTKIEQLTKKEELLQQYKKGVMQKIFNQEIRFKADDGSEFCEWEEYTLNDFLIPTLREVEKPKENYLAIGVRSHCKGTFQKPDSEPDKIAMDRLYVVKENDLIVNITFAWESAIAIVKKEDEGGLVSHRFPTYTFDEKISNSKYFQYVIIQKRFRIMLDLISPGGAGRNRVMSKKDFLTLKWELPCIEEQNKIANFLSSIDTKIQQTQKQLESSKEFKKALLQQMFV